MKKSNSLKKKKIIKRLSEMRGSLKGKAKNNLTDREVREKVGKELEEEYKRLFSD